MLYSELLPTPYLSHPAGRGCEGCRTCMDGVGVTVLLGRPQGAFV